MGETLVATSRGLVSMELLQKMAGAGEELPDVLSLDRRGDRWVVRQINGAWVAGRTHRLVEVRTAAGLAVRCTPRHRFLTLEVGWAEAQELRPGVCLHGTSKSRVDGVVPLSLDQPVPVYDLEVEGTRNFAVTSEGAGTAEPVVVHNSGGRRGSLTAGGAEITVL